MADSGGPLTNQRLPDDLGSQDLASLLGPLIERVLQTESPRILLTRGGPDDRVPMPLLLPSAEVVELSGGIRFVDDMEDYLREQESTTTAVLLLAPLVNWRSLPPEFRRRHPRRALHEVALTRALALVPAGTRIAAVLPVPVFGSEISRSLREAIQPHLRVVMEHEHAWPGVHRAFRMHTAVFEKACENGATSDSLVRFFRIRAESALESHTLANDLDTDLARLLTCKGGKTRWGFVLREGLPLGEPWVYDLYSPQSVELQKDLRELGDLRPLAELADFPRTIQLAARRGALLDGEGAEGIPLLEGRNIGPNGGISWVSTRYRIRKPDELLRPGDICLRAIWNPATQLISARVPWCPTARCWAQSHCLTQIVPHGAPPLAAGHNLIVLRKRTETTEEEWQVLADYLRSPRAADLMAPLAVGSIHLTQSALGELPVPVPDEALRVALRTLTEAAADFESWRNETERQKRSLFGFPVSHEGRLHLMQAGKRARQRQRAGSSVEVLGFRVRTQYPYPLAYRWRTVEARAKGLEDYQNVLDCAETTLGYLALLAIVGAGVVNLRIGKLTQLGRQLVKKGGGIGLGDWVGVLREVGTSRLFRDLNSYPFPEVPSVLTNKDTNDAVQRLQDARNDLAHGRGPKGAAVRMAIEDRCADLELLLEAVEFLSEYPLRLVEETRRDSLSGLTQIGFRDLMGDHPLVPISSDERRSSEIESGSLYFLDRAGSYHLARPWLSWRECPECRRPASFHLERYERKADSVTLKSLEHGHTTVDESLAPVFRALGFLT